MTAEPPVLPGRDQARRWAEEELAKPEYRDAAPGWLDSVWAEILDWLRSLDGGSGLDSTSTVAAPWIGVAITVLIGAAVILARPRLNAKAKRANDVFDAGATVGAEAYRRRAAAEATAGNWSVAVVDCFRALVRTAEDRAVFDARPGRTAGEVAHELATPFPTEASRLTDAARTFDGIRYGNEAAGQADYAAVRALDIALQSLMPASAALTAERDEPAVPR